MDYKTFIKNSLLQNDISSLKKYDKLTRNLVNNKKLNKNIYWSITKDYLNNMVVSL